MVTGLAAYDALIVLVVVERSAELVLARRHTAWSLARGGVEHGRGHYWAIVSLHTGLLLGCLLEPPLLHRPFVPAVGWPMLAVVLAGQALRWWCIATLGPRWNTRVLVIPGDDPVSAGPYRLLPHPNYLAVVAEGFALPMVHDAWLTAIAFTCVNAGVLRVRIRCEDHALGRSTLRQSA